MALLLVATPAAAADSLFSLYASGQYEAAMHAGVAAASAEGFAIAARAALADAAATAVGNAVKSADDIPAALEIASGINGVKGTVVIIGDRIGVWGKLEICRLETDRDA